MASIADALTLIKGIKTFICTPDHATLNFAELTSECELLATNLRAAKQHCAAQRLRGAQKDNVDMILKRCNKTLARVKTALEQGRSLKQNLSPGVQSMYRFSDENVAEWKTAIQSERINLLMIFCINSSPSDPRIKDKVDLIASIVVKVWPAIQGGSSLSLNTVGSVSTTTKQNWRYIRRKLRERGITSGVLDPHRDQIVVQVEKIVTLGPGTEPELEDHASSRDSIATALFEATARKDWSVVKQLLEDNSPLDDQNPALNTAFSLALCHKQWDIVETLVDRGLSPDGISADEDSTPAIIVAAQSQAWSTVELLVRKGANFKVRIKERHTAIAPGSAGPRTGTKTEVNGLRRSRIITPPRATTCQILGPANPCSAMEAQPDEEEEGGDTVLIAAAASRSWSTVSLLIDHGAYVHARGRDGKRALYYVLDAMAPHLHLLTDTAESSRLPSQEALDVDRVAVHLLERGAETGFWELVPLSGGTAGAELQRRIVDLFTLPEGSRSLLNRPSVQ